MWNGLQPFDPPEGAVVPATQPAEAGTRLRKRRIVLTAFGSLGDLHPYVAIALGLKERGHEAVLATSQCYQQKIEALGLGFRAVRPDSDWVADPDVMRRLMDLRTGTVRAVREMVLPVLRESYADTLAAAERADLLVSHPLTGYATRLVAEMTGIPWASTMITPLGFFSIHDMPVLPPAPFLSRKLRRLGPAFWGPVSWFAKRATRFMARPWYRLRSEIGLPPTGEGNPLEDSHSPSLVLALFSELLAARQPDWPPQTVLTGFPFYDEDGGAGLPPALAGFLDDGPPPIVFTLGMSAATVAGPFYEHSVAAAGRLGRRAILILGKNLRNRPAALPQDVVAFDYAPFSKLFPRAAAIVHAGGIGTTGLAMLSGRPMLVMPCAHDQPDNAARVTRLGIARMIARQRYSPDRAARELRHLLDNPVYAQRASAVGAAIRQEDGVRAACDALERLLQTSEPKSEPKRGRSSYPE
jgi:UDP:flavonoid glycosyltransferase YjiC (YdhE family)